MPGRPDFSTPGTNGSEQTVATTNRPEVESTDVTRRKTLSPGDEEQIEIFAPEGSIYRVKALFFRTPGPGGNGSHKLVVKSQGEVTALKAFSSAGDRLRHSGSTWEDATIKARPPGSTAQAIANLRATADAPISLAYTNESDTDQTGTRSYLLTFEEVSY